MSFQLRASISEVSKPLQSANLSVLYTDKIVTKGLPGETDIAMFNSSNKYDVVRTSAPRFMLNMFPDGQPILEAADLPCLSNAAVLANGDRISVIPSEKAYVSSRGQPENVRISSLIDNDERKANTSSLQSISIPIFLPPLQVGSHFLDPQQISAKYSDAEVYKLQTQARFSVGPGNPSCVECNLRLNPFTLMSGFGPIATSEGAKPFLFPQISTSSAVYVPSHGVFPNDIGGPDFRCDSKKEIFKKERSRFAVKNLPGPPAFAFNGIIYDGNPDTCDTPRSIGVSHGNLVERGMTVTDTNRVLRYAISNSPAIPPFRFPKSFS